MVYKRLRGHRKSVEELTGLENVLIGEQVLAHELSELVGCVFYGHLWMRHTEGCWGGE